MVGIQLTDISQESRVKKRVARANVNSRDKEQDEVNSNKLSEEKYTIVFVKMTGAFRKNSFDFEKIKC